MAGCLTLKEKAIRRGLGSHAPRIIGTTLEGAANHCGGFFNRPSA
jgi:hypothetical protein